MRIYPRQIYIYIFIYNIHLLCMYKYIYICVCVCACVPDYFGGGYDIYICVICSPLIGKITSWLIFVQVLKLPTASTVLRGI